MENIIIKRTIEITKEDVPFEYKYFIKNENGIEWIGKPFENIKVDINDYEKIKKLINSENKTSIIDFNIRYENPYDGINNWDNRKDTLIKILNNYSPDIIFLQETTPNQQNFIYNELTLYYIFLGENRDNSPDSEKNNIIYNKYKYDLITNGIFW